MRLEKLNPAAPVRAHAGLGSRISSPAIDPNHITTVLALKRIYARVSVSEPVALVIAGHAGLLREAH